MPVLLRDPKGGLSHSPTIADETVVGRMDMKLGGPVLEFQALYATNG